MFEFYFQTGEFASEANGFIDFLKDLTVQIFGTALGAGLAYFLYRLQTKDQRNKEITQKEQSEKDRIVFFDNLLKMTIDFSKDLERNLGNAIASLKISPTDPRGLTMAPSEDLRRLVFEINHESLFFAYRNHVKCDNVAAIFNYIDSIYSLKTAINEVWDKATSLMVSDKSELFKSLSWMLHEIDEIEILTVQELQAKDQITEIISDYFRDHNFHRTDLEIIEDKFLYPLSDIVLEMIYVPNSKWMSLNGKIHMTLRSIRDVRNRGCDLKKDLENYANLLSEVNTRLTLEYSALEDYFRQNEKKID